MQKDKKKLLTKMIVSFLAVGSLYYCGALDRDCFATAPANAQTGDSEGKVIFNPKGGYEEIYGWYLDSGEADNGQVIISKDSSTLNKIYGAYIVDDNNSTAKGNNVDITSNISNNDNNTTLLIVGAKAKNTSKNIVTIEKGGINASYNIDIYGGVNNSGEIAGLKGTANGNEVNITDSNIKSGNDNNSGSVTITGGQETYAINNIVNINNVSIKALGQNGFPSVNIYGGVGGYQVGQDDKDNGSAEHNYVKITGGNIGNISADSNVMIYGGKANNAQYNTVTISDIEIDSPSNEIIGAVARPYMYKQSTVKDVINNTVTLKNVTVDNAVIAGAKNLIKDAENNVIGSEVNIDGGKISGSIYGGLGKNVKDSIVNITGETDLSKADIFGYGGIDDSENPSSSIVGGSYSGNKLNLNAWAGQVNSVNNFNEINLNDIKWKNQGTVLEILNNNQTSDLSETDINVKSLHSQGGETLRVGDYMDLISGKNLKIDSNRVNVNEKLTDGVATIVEGETTVNDSNGLRYTIKGLELNPQTNLVAESRAVATAFINQGSDLISSGLDSLHDQYGYGFKTFAAVYGNRSTYDVGGDLKINGWSEIIGLGSTKRIGDGDLDWGLFYENGSGNYRTYNQFNDEFFRGDGSMVYNGGGAAARFTKDNGWYYEGSLRAGTLKSEIDHALKDGMGNMYGYKSDTTYYGAHLGVGKIMPLSNSQDLNVYGKYFHTYNDGDDFTIAGDRFSFDSVTSDRIMLGAEITTNKDDIWQTHYGLAWEYEFNGDSDMTAGQFDLPTQSLKGSTFIGEIGFSYRDDKFSPWSFDLDFKGYQGQRDGFSGHAQATYNF